MITQKISSFPGPWPTRQDSESFSQRLDQNLPQLSVMGAELNIMIDQTNTFMTATANEAADSARRAAGSEAAAAVSASNAESAKQSAQIAAVTAGYQGDYKPDVSYLRSQTVSHGGMLFISKHDNNWGNTPVDGDSWALLGLGRIMIMRHL